jgi:HSP20 family molecular chaperone IbpA
MSTKTASTVSVTYDAVATDLTKSDIGKGYVVRTSDDETLTLRHNSSKTARGRMRRAVQLRTVFTDTDGIIHTGQCSVVVDMPGVDSNSLGLKCTEALVSFLQATSLEEADLLVSGHNLG